MVCDDDTNMVMGFVPQINRNAITSVIIKPIPTGIDIFFIVVLISLPKYSMDTGIHGCTGDITYPKKIEKYVTANTTGDILAIPFLARCTGIIMNIGA